MSRKRAVIVVDGISTGMFFAPRLKRRGYDSVHVLSSRKIPAEYQAMIRPEDYIECIVHEGDIEATLKAIAKYEPLAVIAASEPAVELGDILSERLGVRTNGTALSAARRNKFKMIEAVHAAGVPTCSFRCSEKLDEIMDWAGEQKSWPVVLKPLMSAGTDSVFFCESPAEVERRFQEIKGHVDHLGNANAAVLAETFLKGIEYPVNTVSLDGKHYLSDCWRYDKLRLPGGHSMVYNYTRLLPSSGPDVDALKEYVFRVLDALGIKNGPAHAEIMLTPDGPRLVEIGARVMGGSVVQELVIDAMGHSQVDWTIACYLEPENFHRLAAVPYTIRKHILDKSLITEKAGRLTGVPGWKRIETLESYFSSSLSVKVGDYLPQTVDMFTMPGTVLLAHPDPAVVEADYETIRALEKDGLFAQDVKAAPSPVAHSLALTLPKDLRFVASFTSAARQFAVMNGASGAKATRLEAGIEEALSLVVRTAPPSSEPEYIELHLERRADGFAVRLLIREPGHDPEAAPEYDVARAIETGDTSGLELRILKGLMDEVSFQDYEPGRRMVRLFLKD